MNVGETEAGFARRLERHGYDQLSTLLEHFAQPFHMDSGKSFAPLLNAERVKDQYLVAKRVALQVISDNAKKPESTQAEITSEYL